MLDLPLAQNTIFRAGALVNDFVLAQILFLPATKHFVVFAADMPGADIVGTFAAYFLIVKLEVQVHPASLGAMVFDKEPGPGARG